MTEADARNLRGALSRVNELDLANRELKREMETMRRRVSELETWRGSFTTVVNLLRASISTSLEDAGIKFRIIGGQ